MRYSISFFFFTKMKKSVSVLNILACFVLLYSFDLNTILIFTVVNLYSIPETRISNNPSRVEKWRTIIVFCNMIILHVLQGALWMNPGPCFDTIAEITINLPQITLSQSLLIDINGLISIKFIREFLKVILRKFCKWVKKYSRKKEITVIQRK